jgi:molybdate transport system regulatory protein
LFYRKRALLMQDKSSMPFKLKYKIWLETTGKVFGQGPCDILLRIKRLGSLRAAAAEMGMSYSHAWKLIKGLEKRLGYKLLDSQVGGVSGGGAVLTPEARELIKRYRSLGLIPSASFGRTSSSQLKWRKSSLYSTPDLTA